jgi:hypothetical protein
MRRDLIRRIDALEAGLQPRVISTLVDLVMYVESGSSEDIELSPELQALEELIRLLQNVTAKKNTKSIMVSLNKSRPDPSGIRQGQSWGSRWAILGNATTATRFQKVEAIERTICGP